MNDDFILNSNNNKENKFNQLTHTDPHSHTVHFQWIFSLKGKNKFKTEITNLTLDFFDWFCCFFVSFCLFVLDSSLFATRRIRLFFISFVRFTVDGGAAAPAPAAVTTVQCSYDFFLLFLFFISVHIEHFRWTVCAVGCVVPVTLSTLLLRTHEHIAHTLSEWCAYLCVCYARIRNTLRFFPSSLIHSNFSPLFPLCLSVPVRLSISSNRALVRVCQYSNVCSRSRVYWSFIMRTPSISTNISHSRRLQWRSLFIIRLFSFCWLFFFFFFLALLFCIYLARKHQF